MIIEIASYLLSNSGLPWEQDVNFFVGYLPIKNKNERPIPKRVMVLLESVPGDVIGDLPDRVDFSLQIWNRADDYWQARDDAMQMFEIIHGDWWRNLPILVSGKEYRWWSADAKGTPAPIANPNDNSLFEFSTNYLLRICNMSA